MDSFREFAANLGDFNKTLGELHGIGVQHDVQLPELVLLGDQSAGKSSLMSGLAGFNLPRSDGACTRCVTHIRVSPHAEWSCRVSLRKSYAYEEPEYNISPDDVTTSNPFPPWTPIPQQIQDFQTIQDPAEIEEVLKWAQIAILNPNSPAAHYIPGSGHVATQPDGLRIAMDAIEASAVKFSPNVIALEIKGPDYPELSFYDLPGVFATSPTQRDEYTKHIVSNLAKSYIRHDAAILIWAVPMNSDPHNSIMLSLIRGEHALDRTVGVITKADLFQNNAAARAQWLRVLNNETFNVGLGYYVTSRTERPTVEDQEKWERMFFDDETRFVGSGSVSWPPDGFQRFSLRCGVGRLKKEVSDRIGKAFRDCLPQIKEKVAEKLSKAEADLKDYPELPANPELVIHTSLNAFADYVKYSLQGGGDFDGKFQATATAFSTSMLNLKPRVRLTDLSDTPSHAGAGADRPIELIDEDDASTNALGKRRVPFPPVTPSKRQNRGLKNEEPARPPSASPSVASVGPINRPVFSGSSRPPTTDDFGRFSPSPARTLAQIRDLIDRMGPAGIPSVVDPRVHRELCKEAVTPWEGPPWTFLDLVMKMVQEIVETGLRTAFISLQRRAVFAECRAAMERFLRNQRAETDQLLRKELSFHTRKVFTVNKDDLNRLWKEEKDHLHHYRHYMRWRAYMATPGQAAPYIPLEQIPQDKRTAEERERRDQLARLGKDRFEGEIDVFAYIRAYYRLAVARFIDSVSLILYSDMVPAIEEKLVGGLYLARELGVIPPKDGVYQELMKEEDWITIKRTELKRDIQRFKSAMDSIGQLESRISGPSAAGGRSYPTPRSMSEVGDAMEVGTV
jgi:GTPase SAR1 family protein